MVGMVWYGMVWYGMGENSLAERKCILYIMKYLHALLQFVWFHSCFPNI